MQHKSYKIFFLTAGILLTGLLLYLRSGLAGADRAFFQAMGESPWVPVLMLLSMGAAWTFALPASVFFFIIPLFYDPLPSSFLIASGSMFGALTGYYAAKNLGGPWMEKFRSNKITRLLSHHSHFPALFAIRIMPGSPHGFINYGAGLAEIPIGRFVVATGTATAIKGFLYAVAVQGAVDATSLPEALNWQTISALFGIALLALAGRWVKKKWFDRE